MQQRRPPQAVEGAVRLGPRGAPPRLAGRRAPDHLVRRPARPFALARRRKLPAGAARRGPQVGARGGRSPASGPSMRQTAPGVATVRRLPPLLRTRHKAASSRPARLRTSAARLRARRRASVRRDRRGCTPASRSPAARRRAPRPSRFRRCWLLHPSVLVGAFGQRGAWRFLEGRKRAKTRCSAHKFLQG